VKKFIVTTTSDSSDHYIYLIGHPQKPTSEELVRFLNKCGSDIYEGESCESVDDVFEMMDDKFLTIPE
jgi:hypothetical protein